MAMVRRLMAGRPEMGTAGVASQQNCRVADKDPLGPVTPCRPQDLIAHGLEGR